MLTPQETSPYNLIQEKLRMYPWRLLVACIMLNQTSIKQVNKIIWKFFERYPDPDTFRNYVLSEREGLISEDPKWQELVNMIRPLGFCNRRAWALYRMSCCFVFERDLFSPPPMTGLFPPECVKSFYGVGKYAYDSYMMFVGGTIVEDVQDKELKNYVRWAKGCGENHG